MSSDVTQDFGLVTLPTGKGQGHRAPANPPVGARHSFPSLWQRERARRLHFIFLRIERRRAAGQSLRRAVRWFAWYWKDRTYKCDPHRAMRFSSNTLVRLFYRWQNGGRTPEALVLHYRSGRSKLGPAKLTQMARACATPGVRSFLEAWRQIPNAPATHSAFRHAMPAQLRTILVELCDARRRVEYLERRAQKTIAHFESAPPKATP